MNQGKQKEIRMAKGNNGPKGGMTQVASARIQSAGARSPGSRTAQTGFGPRAQSAAATASGQGKGK